PAAWHATAARFGYLRQRTLEAIERGRRSVRVEGGADRGDVDAQAVQLVAQSRILGERRIDRRPPRGGERGVKIGDQVFVVDRRCACHPQALLAMPAEPPPSRRRA